jgi:MFS family permease
MSGPASAATALPSSRGLSAAAWTGWINVVVGAVIMLATFPGRTQGLGLITEPMLRDLQLDRVTYANINLWATLAGAIICLPVGRLFDRIGLRIATCALTLMLAAIVWTMSRTHGSVLGLFLLVLGTRAIGQSALSVASITAVGKSFDRQVGVAMGVYSVLLTVFMAAAFTGIGSSVGANGWRTAWAQVALGLVLFAAPISLFLRERSGSREPEKEEAIGGGLSLAAALRTPAFWVFAIATSLFGLVSSGLGLFNEAVLAERGFDQPTYVRFLAGTAIVGLFGQLGCGWLSLRWSLQRLLGLSLAIYALTLLALPLLRSQWDLWFVAVLFGVAGGMITVIFFAVWRQAFGSAHLGRIQGAAQMLTVLASAIGPLMFAKLAEVTGSYMPALWVLAPCVLALSFAAFRITLPNPSAVS